MKTALTTSITALLILTEFLFCSDSSDSVRKQIISLEAEDISYSAAELHLKANVPYRLTFKNKGNMIHDFNSEKMPVRNLTLTQTKAEGHEHSHHINSSLHIAASGGKSSSAEFTVSKPGIYEYYCSVPGHREAGMRGTVYVHN